MDDRLRWLTRLGIVGLVMGTVLTLLIAYHDVSPFVGLIVGAITSDRPIYHITWLAWSPDSRQIALERSEVTFSGDRREVVLVQVDGSAPSQLVDAQAVAGWARHTVDDGARIPAPDDRQVAEVAFDTLAGPWYARFGRVMVSDAAGRASRRVYPAVVLTELQCPPQSPSVAATFDSVLADAIMTDIRLTQSSVDSSTPFIAMPHERVVTLSSGEHVERWDVLADDLTGNVWVGVWDDEGWPLSQMHCVLYSPSALGLLWMPLGVIGQVVTTAGAAMILYRLRGRHWFTAFVVVLLLAVVLLVVFGVPALMDTWF